MGRKLECRHCGVENERDAERCGDPGCLLFDWKPYDYVKPQLDRLVSIDGSLKTIKRIAIYFLILSITGAVVGLMAAAGAFR